MRERIKKWIKDNREYIWREIKKIIKHLRDAAKDRQVLMISALASQLQERVGMLDLLFFLESFLEKEGD